MAIYLNPRADDPGAARTGADRAIEMLVNHPADFVHAVYRGAHAARWGGYPEAYALLNLRDGFAVTGNFDGPLIRGGVRSKGVHGFVPDRQGTHGALIMSGAGVPLGLEFGIVHMEDIAPTIAGLLSLHLPDATGVDLLARTRAQ